MCSAIGEEGIITRIPNDHLQQQQELSCPSILIISSHLLSSSIFAAAAVVVVGITESLSLSRSSFCFERQLNEICVLLEMAKAVSKKERKAKKVQEKAQFAEIDRRLEQGKRFLFRMKCLLLQSPHWVG